MYTNTFWYDFFIYTHKKNTDINRNGYFTDFFVSVQRVYRCVGSCVYVKRTDTKTGKHISFTFEWPAIKTAFNYIFSKKKRTNRNASKWNKIEKYREKRFDRYFSILFRFVARSHNFMCDFNFQASIQLYTKIQNILI